MYKRLKGFKLEFKRDVFILSMMRAWFWSVYFFCFRRLWFARAGL